MPEAFFVLLIIGGLIVVGGLIWLSITLERKRREAFQLLATRLGLQYSPEMNRGLATEYSFLSQLNTGDNRYASHILRGSLEGCDVLIFDHHYETTSTDSKGNRTTHHYHHSVYTLRLPKAFPELKISPEGIFSKIAQAFGYDDIDFESAEFSRAFCVRSKDKRFAYDVCHALAIEFLLANRDLALEIEGNTLATVRSGSLAPDAVVDQINRLLAFRRLLPEYLFQN